MIGRMPFSEDFAALSRDFQNPTFCGASAGNILTTIDRSANGRRALNSTWLMIYTGPSAARPDDDIGLAVGKTYVNSRMAGAK
jgi:carbohydrate-selective porin OprB